MLCLIIFLLDFFFPLLDHELIEGKTVVWLFSWNSSWFTGPHVIRTQHSSPALSGYTVHLASRWTTPNSHTTQTSIHLPSTVFSPTSNLPRWPSFLFAMSLLSRTFCSLSNSQLNVTSSKNLTLTSRPREVSFSQDILCFFLHHFSLITILWVGLSYTTLRYKRGAITLISKQNLTWFWTSHSLERGNYVLASRLEASGMLRPGARASRP